MRENLMQKVAEVAPDHYLFLERTADEIRYSPFRDEIAAEMDAIIKTAEQAVEKMAFGFGAMGKGLQNAATSMMENPAARYIGATITGGVALSLAGDLYDAARRGLTKSRYWSNMLEANPDLAERAKSDPQVKVMFNTLHRFNPDFASDPHVAANFVNAQLEFPTDISIPQQLVKARGEIRGSGGFRNVPGLPQPKSKNDLEEQRLRMEGQRAQTDKNRADIGKIEKEVAGDPAMDALKRDQLLSQIQSQKAQAFKNRQDALQAYNQRMGMGTPEQMDQLRRRAGK